MSIPVGRGAQVRLDGEQQRAARGAGAPSLVANIESKRVLEHGGAVSTGYSADGSSPLGVPPEEEVLVPFGEGPEGELVSAAEVAALAARVTGLERQLATLRAEMDALNQRWA